MITFTYRTIKGFILISLLCAGLNVFAQQDPQFSQYMFNITQINPAYTGSKDFMSAILLYRNQWVGLDGAPKTQTFTLHTPIVTKKIGLGFSYINDKIGPTRNSSFYIDYAYRLKISESSSLAMGLKSGFDLQSIDFLSLQTTDINDDAFLENMKNKFMPNFGFGLYYYTNNYYLGISVPRLLKNKISGKDVITGQAGKQERHTFIIAGYVKDINENIKFKPTIQSKLTIGAPVSIDLAANFLFYDRLWLGGIYRFGDSFGGMVQYLITDQLSFGYVYEYTLSQLSHYNKGTHEIMLTYDFHYKAKKLKSPRYF
jgi:type IX secretion system PorP/SprF family membrane protein